MQLSRSFASVLFVVSLFFCASSDILASAQVPDLISPQLLKQAGLEKLWQNSLPFKSGEHLDRMFLIGDSVFALSDTNYLVRLSRTDGKFIFGNPFAPPGIPVTCIEPYDNQLLSVSGNKLQEVDPQTGQATNARELPFPAAGCAVRNKEFYYVPGTDRRLHILREKDKVQLFEVAASTDSEIVSVTATDTLVIFATSAGNVVCIKPDAPSKIWQFDAADAVVGQIIRDNDLLIFASRDTNIYCLNLNNGKLIWKYQTPALLDKAPCVAGNIVYQNVTGKGLFALDKKTGKLAWQLPQGKDFLARSGNTAYVITDDRSLVVMDNVQKKKLYAVNVVDVARYVPDTVDSRLYIADANGRVECIKPAK